jgi:ABC transporter substrate binding protein (PQQ-dependent alcohol dehydrogenase system)
VLDRRIQRSFAAILAMAMLIWPRVAAAEDETPTLVVGFLTQAMRREPPQPYLDAPPVDEGLAGARLAVDDDNTTGRFTNQHFALEAATVPEGGDVAEDFRRLVAKGIRFVVADLPAPALLAVADLPQARDVTIFNAGAPDDELRNGTCRGNLLHTLPSRAMLADALVQYLLVKQWSHIFLVTGPSEADRAYAAAVRRAIAKFGATLVAEKPWTYEPGSRRSDTGHYQESAEVARFTQGVSYHLFWTYDVLVLADEEDAFGDYFDYATFDPRPIAGTHGLRAAAWARPHQEWGATQLQDRFRHQAKRWMTDRDYAAWLAVRAVAEAATRAQTMDPPAVAAYMRSDQFELGGYKGVPLSFRPWDGQMRQAILLYDSRALVSVSPQLGFEHQTAALDTIGDDKPESQCRLH